MRMSLEESLCAVERASEMTFQCVKQRVEKDAARIAARDALIAQMLRILTTGSVDIGMKRDPYWLILRLATLHTSAFLAGAYVIVRWWR